MIFQDQDLRNWHRTIAFIGIYLSYYLDIASGASVVLLSTLVFGCVLLWKSVQSRRKHYVPPLCSQHYQG
ncbi:metal ABC transporter permease [Tolypothrix sp. PCC 7910]|uniref:metal ABC transporter permease n=1 Tax=Tolypothrix sp. PCC 7910 TaxID=2099387 RepID=UPI001FCAB5FF|nr:metal ABC transporter permease [Tolypothrix sp. PCC 7910]